MTDQEQRLIEFAKRTLAVLESQTEWSASTPDDIATEAFNLKVATTDDEGLFKSNLNSQ